MKVAIIGGGASGMVTAWLLNKTHDVTVFERQPILGGHIRTVGRNVPRGSLPDGVYLDAGVVEFTREEFPTFHRLMDELSVELRHVPGTNTLFRKDGDHLHSVGNKDAGLPLLKSLKSAVGLAPLALQRRRFLDSTKPPIPAIYERPLADFLGHDDYGIWLRLVTMYAYSIPFEAVGNVAAALAVPMLRAFSKTNSWSEVVGGPYVYFERMLESFHGTVHTSASIDSVRRNQTGVRITMSSGEDLRFDAVVFAAPPDQVLQLLQDPSDAERRRFYAWRPNHIETILHYDRGMYERRDCEYPGEFDVFELPGYRGGYNALLNRLGNLPDDEPRQYGLAYGMRDEIDPQTIVHIQPHHTPHFSVEALRSREEVRETNGENHTWHAGAWLGDGLHESALTSAVAVSVGLGGRRI